MWDLRLQQLLLLQRRVWTHVCLSVCQWDVWCSFAFVMVDCGAFQTPGMRTRPVSSGHPYVGRGLPVCLSNPALPWRTHRELNPRYLAMPPLQLHAHGFTSASDKDKTTSALQADGGRETKEAQILIRSVRPEPVCATVFSLQMFVLHSGDIFAQTTQRKQFSSSCNNNRQPDFIYEILSKDVGEETSWQVSETTSVSSLTMGDIPHDELNLVSETFNPFWKPGFSFLNSLKPVLTSC